MLLAGSSLLTLLDDIATLLDDISVMGKLAAKKTAGNFPWSGAWRKDR